MKVSKNGGSPSTIASGLLDPGSLAIDSTSVYWASYLGGTIMKVPLGGGTPTVLATEQNWPVGISVDNTSVYWTTCHEGPDGTVMKLSPK